MRFPARGDTATVWPVGADAAYYVDEAANWWAVADDYRWLLEPTPVDADWLAGWPVG